MPHHQAVLVILFSNNYNVETSFEQFFFGVQKMRADSSVSATLVFRISALLALAHPILPRPGQRGLANK